MSTAECERCGREASERYDGRDLCPVCVDFLTDDSVGGETA